MKSLVDARTILFINDFVLSCAITITSCSDRPLQRGSTANDDHDRAVCHSCFTGCVLLCGPYMPYIRLSCMTFYSAPQCSHCKRCTSYGNSVRLSVRLSVTRRYCVKTTARSTVQFALLDSKICLVL